MLDVVRANSRVSVGACGMLLDRKWTNETTDHATPVSEGKRPTFLTFLALLLDGLGGLTVGGG